jgi:hypothetical protein
MKLILLDFLNLTGFHKYALWIWQKKMEVFYILVSFIGKDSNTKVSFRANKSASFVTLSL